jgi:hypothetical protein
MLKSVLALSSVLGDVRFFAAVADEITDGSKAELGLLAAELAGRLYLTVRSSVAGALLLTMR